MPQKNNTNKSKCDTETFSFTNPSKRHINNKKDLKSLLKNLRALGLKIVVTQGSFDMIHIGHARYLEKSKEYGDFLIVGTDSDKKIRHRKGNDRPIIPQEERVEMLTHLKAVDAVFVKQLDDPKWYFIKTVRPDVLIIIKGTYSKEEKKELKKYCGKIISLNRQATTSTSQKIRLLQIGTTEKFVKTITPKVVKVIEQSVDDIKKGK